MKYMTTNPEKILRIIIGANESYYQEDSGQYRYFQRYLLIFLNYRCSAIYYLRIWSYYQYTL